MRKVAIIIDTVGGSVTVSDRDTTTAQIIIEYTGSIGRELSIERGFNIAYTAPSCQIRIVTPHGPTGLFAIDDLESVEIDGVEQTAPETIQELIDLVSPYLFISAGGDPVTITDTDLQVYEVDPGGSFTCAIPVAESTVTFNYASGNQYRSFHRIGFVGSVTAAALTNVASYTIYKNGVLITPLVFPLALAQDDRLYVTIVPTNAALAASIQLSVTGITSAVAFNSLNYAYPRSMSYKRNVVELTDMMLHSDVAIKGQGGTSGWDTNVIYGDPISGEFDLIFVPSLYNFAGTLNLGLNDRTVADNTANPPARARYLIRLNANGWEVYEFNVNKVIIGLANNQQFHHKIESRMTSPGVYTVKYYYSNNNMSTWTLGYTSLSTHNGAVSFYPDVQLSAGFYAEMKPPIFKQL